MRKSRSRRQLLLLGALALLASGCATEPLTERVDPEGRRVVLLLDSSTSMRRNDPDQVASVGVELIAGLVGSEDNLGVVAYAAEPAVVLPLQPVGNAAARAAFRRAVADIERNGTTDFAQALESARAMLEAGDAPRGSVVILLTDGVPYRGRRRSRWRDGPSLGDAVQTLADKGWRIFAIALGDEASTPFLSRIVAKTGGAVFPVPKVDQLLATFEDVAIEALGYLRAERGERETRVAPHTGRLAFLGTWSEQGELGAVSHDGKTHDTVIRTPQGKSTHAVGLVEGPQPGTWSVEAAGAQDVVVLVEPRFNLEFMANHPPARVGSRAKVPLALELSGDPEAVRAVAPRLHVQASLELNDKPWGPKLTLEIGDVDDRFEGSFTAPLVNEESSLRVMIEATLVEGGRPFVLKRTRSLTVRPGDGKSAPLPVQMSLTPQEVTRVAWWSDALEPIAFELVGDPDRPVTVSCAGRSVTVDAKKTATLQVPTPKRGGNLRVSGKAEDGGRWWVEVPIRVRRYRLKRPRELKLPSTPAGMETAPVRVPVSLAPQGTLVWGSSVLRGPGGALLPVATAEGTVQVSPKRDLPLGTYRGTLSLSIKEAPSLRAVELPLRVEVLAPLKAPRAVALKGSWGWVTTPIEVALPVRKEVPVVIASQTLKNGKAQIDPTLDVRIQPMDGWSGKLLGSSPRRFALSVYLSSDLPAGFYKGSVTVATRERQPLVIPITLEVRR